MGRIASVSVIFFSYRARDGIDNIHNRYRVLSLGYVVVRVVQRLLISLTSGYLGLHLLKFFCVTYESSCIGFCCTSKCMCSWYVMLGFVCTGTYVVM